MCFDTEQVTATTIEKCATDPVSPYRVADDYLEMIGWLLLAFYAWARTLRLVARASGDVAFYVDKRVRGRYFFDFKVAEFSYRNNS